MKWAKVATMWAVVVFACLVTGSAHGAEATGLCRISVGNPAKANMVRGETAPIGLFNDGPWDAFDVVVHFKNLPESTFVVVVPYVPFDGHITLKIPTTMALRLQNRPSGQCRPRISSPRVFG